VEEGACNLVNSEKRQNRINLNKKKIMARKDQNAHSPSPAARDGEID
jgi:hypothetical protein